jgi:predicted amidohydrolase YtcJ
MNADLVVRGGRIFTGVPSNPFVSAVAAIADRVVGTGPEAEGMIGPETLVIEFDGALATPGFIDAHVHPATSGLDKLRCDFDGVEDGEEALTRIAAYASANPELPWIIGAGWPQSWFHRGCPAKQSLDSVVPDRPVLIENTDGHGAWVNSRALEIAGVDRHTPDPSDGRIERLPDGEPQGTLHEGAIRLVSRHAPADGIDDYHAGLIRGQQELLGCGITAWQDANVSPAVQGAYIRLAEEGGLTGRVVGALGWDRNAGMEQIDDLVERRLNTAPGFRPTSVKLILDGVAENFTAAMLEPYLGVPAAAHESGVDFIDPGELTQIVTRLDGLGFQCHFHAIGDRAVRHALDSIEAAQSANGPRDNRHHIAHIQVIHPDDIPRFARLDVVANAQPLWACNDEYQTELTRPVLGEERSDRQYPFGSLLRSGARLAMGSDWAVSTANVMEEIDVAVTRTCLSEGEPLVASEAIDPIEALTAFTSGSAYINHAERDSGTLAVGKLADLAILDRDPLRDGPFREAKVAATVVGGEVVLRNM